MGGPARGHDRAGPERDAACGRGPAGGDEDDPVLVVEPVDESALRRSTAERKLEQHGFTQTAAAKVRTRA
jgi:hypothetical protein